ncbi:hypothetical protein QOZ88_05930 [Blastococcus sp. BMG 814]|uniref:Phage terminase-like protein, large subunit, contains N-terminal HTH domain n=1 Tax=Blastococcus carthaginiensis TaxID=3050034 RepID=A0ABT9IAH4_9ACTN|nr:hypothetical protein [Blastococcus carthaginiensis]MDP5182169.1 hypothetical protein [Blastococcus carthaginiensis]
MPWKPQHPGDVPTLGWYVLDWMTAFLARPALGYYEPFTPYQEQADFILRWYELDPQTCRFRHDRGVIQRPRGWGKSPLLASLAIVEGLADVFPAGWDADGQPVGQPWSNVRTPLVQIAAVTEQQTRFTWQPLLEMLRDGPVVDEFPGLEPLDSFVNLPRGRIEQMTASPRSARGAPATFVVMDQTEAWTPSINGPTFAQTLRTNAAKNGGRTLESPNAFVPGENSVAEDSAKTWALIREGRSRKTGLLYDHREAPPETDMADRESLVAGLRVAYGDSSGHEGGCVIHEPACPPGHVDLESQISVIWDPATDPQLARADYLNQITHASDSWLSQPEWAARWGAPEKAPNVVPAIADRDTVVLGFDGSRKRKRGITDATALIGCRVSDGHIFVVQVWEQPDGPAGDDWQVPTVEVEAEIRQAFARWNVVGFYADPALWESYVANWEATYGARLKVGRRDHPIEWWMNRPNLVVQAVEQLHAAVVDGEMTHDGHPVLTRHVLNARNRRSKAGMSIAKADRDSPNKIDAAVAAVLAWQCRLDALAKGLGRTKAVGYVRRIR